MQIAYLEIVTPDVEGICQSYTETYGVSFGPPVKGLGNARTAQLPQGGRIGVRAPMRDTENPVVRPYWFVDDVAAAAKAAEHSGATLALPPTEIPGEGTFAIIIRGGTDHGIWQR